MSETTKSTQAMIDETKAIQAETALMMAKMALVQIVPPVGWSF